MQPTFWPTFDKQPLLVEQQAEIDNRPTFAVKHISNAQYDAKSLAGLEMFPNLVSVHQVSILMDNAPLHTPFIIYKVVNDFPSVEALLSSTQLRQLQPDTHMWIEALLKTMQPSNYARFNSQLMSSILALVGMPDQGGHLTIAPIIATANVDIVDALFQYCDVHINYQDQYGKSALMYAISAKHYTIVNYLLTRGADVRLQDNDGKTPLMHAVVAGIDLYQFRAIGPRIIATRRVRYNDAQQSQTPIDIPDNTGKTALMFYGVYFVWFGRGGNLPSMISYY